MLGENRRFVMVQSEPVLENAYGCGLPPLPRTVVGTEIGVHRDGCLTPQRLFHLCGERPRDAFPFRELLITYLVNSHDFTTMAHDAEIYRPRFYSPAARNDSRGGCKNAHIRMRLFKMFRSFLSALSWLPHSLPILRALARCLQFFASLVRINHVKRLQWGGGEIMVEKGSKWLRLFIHHRILVHHTVPVILM